MTLQAEIVAKKIKKEGKVNENMLKQLLISFENYENQTSNRFDQYIKCFDTAVYGNVSVKESVDEFLGTKKLNFAIYFS